MKINNYSSWNFDQSFKKDPINLYAYWDNAFTKDECEIIIQLAKDHTSPATTTSKNLDDYRNSEISWIFPSPEFDWIFSRMTNIVVDLNKRYFGFDLYGFLEGIQFTKYTAPSGKYGMHVDNEFDREVRKLSFTLQLSEPFRYEGGDLCLYTSNTPQYMKRDQGHVALFPSYVMHEVTPVTRGTRYSLVSWVTGKPFR